MDLPPLPGLEGFEGIQGDVFDHLLAVLPEFGLRVFQAPAGMDLEKLKG